MAIAARIDPEYRERLAERIERHFEDYREGRIGRWTLRQLLLNAGVPPRDVDSEISLNVPR